MFIIILVSQISKIENINHLSELRVLNLARNLLSIVENLNGLDSLTELNLRHNQVSAIVRNKTSHLLSSLSSLPGVHYYQNLLKTSAFQICQVLHFPILFLLSFLSTQFYNMKVKILCFCVTLCKFGLYWQKSWQLMIVSWGKSF